MENFKRDMFACTEGGFNGQSAFAQYSLNFFDMSLNWEDLKWLTDFSTIPVKFGI